jgi:hypothetical protein
MSRAPLGMLLGLVIGEVDVLLMLPLSFPDRRVTQLGSNCAHAVRAEHVSTKATLRVAVLIGTPD